MLALALVGTILCRSGDTLGTRSLLGTHRSLLDLELLLSSGIDDRHSDEVPGK